MNQHIKKIISIIISVILVIALYQFVLPGRPDLQTSSITQIKQMVEAGQISEIEVRGSEIIATDQSQTKFQAYLEKSATLADYGISPDKVKIKVDNPDKGTFLPNFFTIILPFLLVAGFLYFMLRSAQGANMRALNFGKSGAKLYQGKKKITFSDVAGAEESKQELQEVVEFLRYPEKFRRLGAEIPKGVLLIGPPGTGKTLIARAVAGEAGVPFFSISASEFVEMFVGVGASRVRDAFLQAKRNAPSILFIDELDAIGRIRGSGLGGSHDEREQTLNQILVEMDGFEVNTQVVIMAASNRPDVLDPALLRPGRFDRRVVLDLPDKNERREILRIHLRDKPINSSVDLERIGRGTAGMSGADLKNVANEAAIFAARQDKKTIGQKDLVWAVEKVLLGPERKSKILSEKEKEITAYHEVGHAILGHLLPNTDPIHKISIISRGMALGYTWSLPTEDFHLESKEKFNDQIAQMLGGRVAEEIKFKSITTGAANDLKQATKLARDMVTRFGMSDKLGPVTLGEREELIFLGRELAEHKTYSEKIAAQIDSEVSRIVREAQSKARQILLAQRQKLDEIAQKLLKYETIDGKEFEKLLQNVKLAKQIARGK